MRPPFEHAAQARQVLNDAEEDLREWQPSLEDIQMQSAGMGSNMMPPEAGAGVVSPGRTQATIGQETAPVTGLADKRAAEGEHLATGTAGAVQREESQEAVQA